MGAIAEELIRRSRERIISMERHLEWMRSRGGYAVEIDDMQKDLWREIENLNAKVRLLNGDVCGND